MDEAERDKALLHAADEAADRDTEARNALGRIRPTTLAGLHALIRHHAEDITFLEPQTFGALAFRDLAQVLPPETPVSKAKVSLAGRLTRIVSEAVIFALITDGSAAVAGLPHLI